MLTWYGYAKFKDGTIVESEEGGTLETLIQTFAKGANPIVSMSIYGPDDTEVSWAFGNRKSVYTITAANEFLTEQAI